MVFWAFRIVCDNISYVQFQFNIFNYFIISVFEFNIEYKYWNNYWMNNYWIIECNIVSILNISIFSIIHISQYFMKYFIFHFMPFPGKISILQIRRARSKFPINLITLSPWESDHVHFQAISFLPFYFEFYFPAGHLHVRPQKVSQGCFLWNWVAPFSFFVTSVYFF